MQEWFTADTHFGHTRIIELAHRPFATVGEMDAAMIERWNERVAPGDVVYHLGDFAFADHAPYMERLNGMKHLILGNHDHHNRVGRARSWWLGIHEMIDFWALGHETFLVLCHYGLRVWNRSHHGAIHLYGHSHGNLPGDSQSCDVGVDCWDFRPVSLSEIKARLATLPARVEPDHHVKPSS